MAKRLSMKMDIPWYELDSFVHHRTSTGRNKRTANEQVDAIKEIDKQDNWIFEGTDRESYQCLYQMADTIIFLDTPLWKRHTRIVSRFCKQRLGLEKCQYKPDFWMLKMMFKWTRDFERNRSRLEDKLNVYQEKLIRLRDNGGYMDR
ncbi:P-loop NTPase family protein [Paenibacillus arenilitoris]|uniref:hypothetical protein n=1 Tax=Paenibacillus arenilitoris TaxID=2772299 RepID=UPI001CC25FFC|nr:hypothetical protein [Paenibacillus arenilitoris]